MGQSVTKVKGLATYVKDAFSLCSEKIQKYFNQGSIRTNLQAAHAYCLMSSIWHSFSYEIGNRLNPLPTSGNDPQKRYV